jgi:3-deoxy-D-manno-octulosonate 8-phosphate phosphatase (KDO 8-P phosphatase)
MDKIFQKAKDIRLLICDLDGVLTDGYLMYGHEGEAFKAFHVHDGFGLKLLMLSGVYVAVITTADTPIVHKRMNDLGIEHRYLGQVNKLKAYDDLLSKLKLTTAQVAFIGDDLPDLQLIQKSGLGIAVANANEQIHKHADWITHKNGGHGAVREVCDLIMTAQNSLHIALDKYHTV